MELNDSLDAVAPLRSTPRLIGQPACVKVLIDGNVVAKTLRRGKQGVQFDQLDRLFFSLAALCRIDRFQYGASFSVTFGMRLKTASDARESTACSKSQSSCTSVSTPLPLSGSDSTLTTCGKYALDAVRISRRLGRLQSSVLRPSHGRAPRHVPNGFISSSVAS